MERDELLWTEHYIERSKERLGVNAKRALKLAKLAWERGIRSGNCRWSVDRRFLEQKSGVEKEAIAFNGFCYIFHRSNKSVNCITVFRLPKDFGKKKSRYYSNRVFDELTNRLSEYIYV